MNRNELDAFVARHRLPHAAVETVLDAAHARPSADEMQRFAQRMLRLAGVLSLAAGIVFFIAANWAVLPVIGRFALVQLVLALSVGLALWKPPPLALGRYGLLMAFITTGVLLALFGQTYQTGADVYELFLTWALLGTVFAAAAQWSVVWAAWVLVLNTSLLLFCGARPDAGLFWVVLAAWWTPPLEQLLLAPLLVNLLAWGVVESLQATRWSAIAAPWLGRLVLACSVGFGTWAGAIAILGSGFGMSKVVVVLLVLAAFAGIVVYALRRRRDAFPVAMVAGALIVLGACALGRAVGAPDIGVLFVLAVWLIAASTLSGRVLMRLVRTWRPAGVVQ